MTTMNFKFLAFSAIIILITSCAPDDSADKILHNGNIVTMDNETPEAEALAIKNGEILAVGDYDDLISYQGAETELIDLDGQLAIPGFIEGHGHFTGIGNAELQLALRNLSSWQEIVDMVAEAAEEAEDGELIRGRGWHQNDWDTPPERQIGDLPHHEKLSEVSPDNPVVLTHASGHMSFANQQAIEMAGVDAQTSDPDGGEIVRDEQGNPAGAFRQTAQGLLSEVTDLWDPEIEELADSASKQIASYGITTFQDAGTSIDDISELMAMVNHDNPDIRLWMMVRDNNETMQQNLPDYAGVIEDNPYFKVGGIKKAIDGALGTHGAWLLQPYEDDPETTGYNTTPLDEIIEAGELALEHDLQLAVHAIGDRGNRETLDIFEQLFEDHDVIDQDLRWRIEHAQHLHPDDIPRFAELDVVASMQAIHATSDGPWVYRRLGDQRAEQGAYVWRTLLDQGTVIVNGTDAPVEPVDPLGSFHASVTREMDDGEIFFENQTMTREEALRSYTLDAAYAIFEEDSRGSLSEGKLADITILDRDIMSIPENEITDTEVKYTIVGGEIIYERE